MKSIAQNVQAYAGEVKSFVKSPEARDAERALHALHPAFPSLVERAAGVLHDAGISVNNSSTTARRLGDAIMNELIASGGDVGEHNHSLLTKDVLRNVLVQEASGHEYVMRHQRDRVREVENDLGQANGEAAMKILEKSKVNVTRIFGTMEDEDLRRASAGGYNHLTPPGRDLIAEALGKAHDHTTMRAAIVHDLEPAAQPRPTMNAARRQERPSPALLNGRQPTFGRRLAARHAAVGAAVGMGA